jgi:hypothetical protein
VNDGESSDDDSILAGIEETRIRLSTRNFAGSDSECESGPDALAGHNNNDNNSAAVATLRFPGYSPDDIAADEADLNYFCPLILGFATEDPVVFQERIYERGMLQAYFDGCDDDFNTHIPHPVHRTPVAHSSFMLALSSQESILSLQREAQEAELSYESRAERRDAYDQWRQLQEGNLVSSEASTTPSRQHSRRPDDALLPDYFQ